ncbi:phosphatase PAP2 family protein [Corynebacterium heidelbergense]|nr:phosphatase PAP2 family protein [Corynebacterium heidelbergense]
MGETRVLLGIQRALADRPGVLPTARLMSHFGEHALGWMGTAALGYTLDRRNREQWLAMGVSAFAAHAASVILKRIIRRPRPHDPRINIGVTTPSKLSFPSSHATSSTAGLVGLSRALSARWPLVGIPAMGLSRMVLGVHYPTDVALGAGLGLVTEVALGKSGVLKKFASPHHARRPHPAPGGNTGGAHPRRWLRGASHNKEDRR